MARSFGALAAQQGLLANTGYTGGRLDVLARHSVVLSRLQIQTGWPHDDATARPARKTPRTWIHTAGNPGAPRASP